jgi:hypothetical protein
MERLMAICCICGVVYREGETINGKASHGYCEECEANERNKYNLSKGEPECGKQS